MRMFSVSAGLVLAVCVPVLLVVPATARADWPPMFWEEASTAETAAPVGVQPVLYNVPDGSGAEFMQARTISGQVVNATITLHLRDAGWNPIVGVPASDIWLEIYGVSGNFVACAGGTVADGPTGSDGTTTWQQPLRAGGWTQGPTAVMVWGLPLATNPGLVLRHNSPDINGDGIVELRDVPLFAADFWAGQGAFRSDLRFDGVVNLSDIAPLANAMGAGCP